MRLKRLKVGLQQVLVQKGLGAGCLASRNTYGSWSVVTRSASEVWQSLPASRSASVPGPRRTSMNVATEIPPAARADLQPIVIGMRPPFTSTGRLSDSLELPRHIVSGPLMHARRSSSTIQAAQSI